MNYDKLQADTAINNNNNNSNIYGNRGSTMASRGYRCGKGSNCGWEEGRKSDKEASERGEKLHQN